MTSNAVASQLVNSGTYLAGKKDMARHVSREESEQWKIPTPQITASPRNSLIMSLPQH